MATKKLGIPHQPSHEHVWADEGSKRSEQLEPPAVPVLFRPSLPSGKAKAISNI